MSYNKEDVKTQISLDDMFTLLEYLQAEPEMFSTYIVSKTICHNGQTHKLYYYDNDGFGLFKCYSGECGSFDIFELLLKINKVQDLNSAVYYIVNFFNLQNNLEEIDSDSPDLDDWKYFAARNKLDELTLRNNDKVQLKTFDPDILKYYPQPIIQDWKDEFISKDVCDYMGICYDAAEGNILIPHYDEDNNLVGIRQRTLVKENEKFGKYRPWKSNGVLYNHPLSFNLYNFNNAKENIKNTQLAIIVESEKSVLQYISYFGLKNNICVAVCGSSLSKYQFNLLYQLGIKEIVIAFDKDYIQAGDEEYLRLEKKLLSLHEKYSPMVNVSFLLDIEDNQLDYKSSPLDHGKKTFLELFGNRIYKYDRS